jgi:mRNA turnover protein 4
MDEFPPAMESQFRQLGLQIKLESGKFYLLDDYVVCKEGELLTPEQSKMIVSSKIIKLILFRNIWI